MQKRFSILDYQFKGFQITNNNDIIDYGKLLFDPKRLDYKAIFRTPKYSCGWISGVLTVMAMMMCHMMQDMKQVLQVVT